MKDFFNKAQRFSSIILLTFLVLNTLFSNSIIKSTSIETNIDNENEMSIEEIQNSIQEVSANVSESLPSINSRAYVVLDRATNTILFGNNELEERAMASTTKIMTCIIILENCNLNDVVTISAKAASTGGSVLGIHTGDTITVNDLLYGLMLKSGNDAAVALSEHCAGSVENFALLMNQKAKELNLTNTSYVTPHGLDADEHYTTAYELALLADYALDNETFSAIVGTKTTSVYLNGYPLTISNTNELLGALTGVYGVKTGFTNNANRCLVTACKRDDMDIICVVLGADTKNFRTTDSIKLIEYAFDNYKMVDLKNLVDLTFNNFIDNNIHNFIINKGITQNVSVKLNNLNYNYYPVELTSVDSIATNIAYNLEYNSPINVSDYIGSIYISINDILIDSASIYFNCNIDKKNIFDYFIDFSSLIKNFNIK